MFRSLSTLVGKQFNTVKIISKRSNDFKTGDVVLFNRHMYKVVGHIEDISHDWDGSVAFRFVRHTLEEVDVKFNSKKILHNFCVDWMEYDVIEAINKRN